MAAVSPNLVHLVHYVRNPKVNEETAGRESGNTARSLRSLRSDTTHPVCARNNSPITILPYERSERSEQGGGNPSPSVENLVHFWISDIVNGSERGGVGA